MNHVHLAVKWNNKLLLPAGPHLLWLPISRRDVGAAHLARPNLQTFRLRGHSLGTVIRGSLSALGDDAPTADNLSAENPLQKRIDRRAD